MAEKKIDDAKLGRVAGGSEITSKKDLIEGSRADISAIPTPPGGQQLPDTTNQGSGTQSPFKK